MSEPVLWGPVWAELEEISDRRRLPVGLAAIPYVLRAPFRTERTYGVVTLVLGNEQDSLHRTQYLVYKGSHGPYAGITNHPRFVRGVRTLLRQFPDAKVDGWNAWWTRVTGQLHYFGGGRYDGPDD